MPHKRTALHKHFDNPPAPLNSVIYLHKVERILNNWFDDS